MTEHNNIQEHPEGVQVALEILQNIPEEILDDFLNELIWGTPIHKRAPSKLDVWKKIVNKRFEK